MNTTQHTVHSTLAPSFLAHCFIDCLLYPLFIIFLLLQFRVLLNQHGWEKEEARVMELLRVMRLVVGCSTEDAKVLMVTYGSCGCALGRLVVLYIIMSHQSAHLYFSVYYVCLCDMLHSFYEKQTSIRWCRCSKQPLAACRHSITTVGNWKEPRSRRGAASWPNCRRTWPHALSWKRWLPSSLNEARTHTQSEEAGNRKDLNMIREWLTLTRPSSHS